jgi:hypothetical protein
MIADLLKQALPAVIATWSEEKRENIKKHCQKTAYVVALVELYLYCQLPWYQKCYMKIKMTTTPKRKQPTILVEETV